MKRDAQTAAAGAGTTVHQVFEDWARRRPNATAIRCGTEDVSYSAVDQRANRLARLLRGRGLPAGGVVAVSMERSPDLIVAMLAVLKAVFGRRDIRDIARCYGYRF